MKCYGVKINFKEFHFLDYSDISLGSTVGALSHVTIRRSLRKCHIYGSGHEGWAVMLPGFATSFWRNNGVCITSCVRYDDENVLSVTKIWLTWHLRFSVHNNDTFRSVSGKNVLTYGDISPGHCIGYDWICYMVPAPSAQATDHQMIRNRQNVTVLADGLGSLFINRD